jgi:hypothetical protein
VAGRQQRFAVMASHMPACIGVYSSCLRRQEQYLHERLVMLPCACLTAGAWHASAQALPHHPLLLLSCHITSTRATVHRFLCRTLRIGCFFPASACGTAAAAWLALPPRPLSSCSTPVAADPSTPPHLPVLYIMLAAAICFAFPAGL